jgi:sugar phosphate permease
MGFPPIAKNLSYWFSNSERGFKWSLWSPSHEIGTFLAVIISGFLVVHFGWESAFYVPAIFALLFSIYLYKNLQDKPSSLGLPEIETYRNEVCVSNDENIVEPDLTYFEIFKKYILKNFQIWLLAVAYIFVYVVRYSTVDWIVKYLVDIKSYSIQAAAVKLSFLPLFGVIGTISAGFVSDKFFKGKRAPVNILCLSMLAAVLYLFKINTISYLDYLYIALIGIFTCGPQVLIGGLCAVESSSKKVASAATGFCGMFGYLGAVLSGVGTGFIIDKFGWSGALNYWVYCALIAVFICILLLIEENKKC